MAATQTIDKPRYTGTITYDETMPVGEIKNGLVLINGSSPNARVTVMSFDGAIAAADGGGKGRKPKGVQTDVLQHATISNDGKFVVIVGQSLRAIHEMHMTPPDDVVEIRVELNGKCKGCGRA